jgi:putative ABC transport system permease protein
MLGVRYVSSMSSNGLDVGCAGAHVNVQVVGVTGDLAAVIGLRVAAGRFLSRFDGSSTFAVVGADAVNELCPQTKRSISRV